MGVILAVVGSAVGLGNFLRFPGQAAQYGGGAFMIAYFVSLLIIGLPICWAEWTMGRYAGQRGFHSAAGAFYACLKRPWAKYIGIIGVTVPVIIYMYYVVIESWCLGYAVNFLFGKIDLGSSAEAGAFFGGFTGASADGSAWGFGLDHVGGFLIVVFLLNFVLIYQGISKGIEWFCTLAMPALVVLGEASIREPDRFQLRSIGVLGQLRKPQLWLAAGMAFLGVAGVVGEGTFGLGFQVLPMVFSEMPFGNVFGVLFFFLLFLAAVTNSLSMLQSGIAFVEEVLQVWRKQSVVNLGSVTACGCVFVVFFSKDLKALDTLDFWVGTFLIFLLALIQIITFSWGMGVDNGLREAHKGARHPDSGLPITQLRGDAEMTLDGWIVMLLSVGAVVILFSWCIYKVLTTPEDVDRMHGFEGDLPDRE